MMEILDASAVLAFLKKEKGHEVIKKIIDKAYKEKFSIFIHQVNCIEVIKKLTKYFGEDAAKEIMVNFPKSFFGISNYFDDKMATYALDILINNQVSLADAIGLAFTKIMEGRFWTADRLLKSPAEKEGINIQFIR